MEDMSGHEAKKEAIIAFITKVMETRRSRVTAKSIHEKLQDEQISM